LGAFDSDAALNNACEIVGISRGKQMVRILGPFNLYFADGVLFQIDLPRNDPVYMSFELQRNMDQRWAVVVVDSAKFLELWKNEPYPIHRESSYGNEHTWRADRKFHYAEKGFAQGRHNPVPLAYVSYAVTEQHEVSYRIKWLRYGPTTTSQMVPHVGFTNGITRTIWLLANGCTSFPICCDLPGAVELHRLAGVEGFQVLRISELHQSIAGSRPL
jgi:hypothetical protein